MSDAIRFREGVRNANKEQFIARLHELAPVHRDEAGIWIVTGYGEVREVLLDHERFSSRMMGAMFPLLSDDPPRHSSLRALVSKAFSPARIEAMRGEVQAIADELVARIEPDREVEIVSAVTTPLPVMVIARMLGIPERDHLTFKRWSDAITGLMGDPLSGERAQAVAELRSYFQAVVAERRAAKGEDLISALCRASEAGASLDDEDIVGFAILLLIAGNETTTNLLGSLLNRLAGEPGAFARLKAQPALVEGAIEEALRTDSPAQFVMRVAREDTRLGEHTIRKDEMVFVYLAAANRDPARWSAPEHFDFTRERDRHVAFGHGVHMCIGAPLARLEAQVAMTALLRCFDDVRAGAERARRLPGGILSGFRSLPLVFGSSAGK
jgi:cytochrome P450